MKYDFTITKRNSGKQNVDFQKKTINETIDIFVYHCERYINDNQNNVYGYLDMNDIKAIAKLMKGE